MKCFYGLYFFRHPLLVPNNKKNADTPRYSQIFFIPPVSKSAEIFPKLSSCASDKNFSDTAACASTHYF